MAQALSSLEGDPARGAYVARLSGCITCHTNNESGQPLAGGVEIGTSFGTFVTPNITLDDGHGIGGWTVEEFARAVREGTSPDGRPYYPSFPWPFYRHLTDQDIVDLFAAIRTVPPAPVPGGGHNLSFPFNMRPALTVWKALFADDGPTIDPANRGRWLAEGPGHCGACHTPRNFLGSRDGDRALAGGEGPESERVPPITAEALEEAGWTKADLIYALQTGIKPDGDTFGGSMASLVRGSTRYWSPGDLEAIADYLLQGGG